MVVWPNGWMDGSTVTQQRSHQTWSPASDLTDQNTPPPSERTERSPLQYGWQHGSTLWNTKDLLLDWFLFGVRTLRWNNFWFKAVVFGFIFLFCLCIECYWRGRANRPIFTLVCNCCLLFGQLWNGGSYKRGRYGALKGLQHLTAFGPTINAVQQHAA